MNDTYNYFEAVKNDVLDAIPTTLNYLDWDRIADLDDLADELNDALWVDDAVTGNASGSYFCSTWKAEECLCHNMDLIEEVAEAFGIDPTISAGYEHGVEWWDVSIRCYYLGQAISEAIEQEKEALQRIIDMNNSDK